MQKVESYTDLVRLFVNGGKQFTLTNSGGASQGLVDELNRCIASTAAWVARDPDGAKKYLEDHAAQ